MDLTLITGKAFPTRLTAAWPNLLKARQSLLARWKGQRLSRRLRKKISELNKTIEERCRVLAKQQWDEVCNSVDGQMRNGKTWNLLKHLLDEANTRTSQRHLLARTAHEAKQSSSEEEVMKRLVQKYLPVDSSRATTYPKYGGPANLKLDAKICSEEFHRALHELNGRRTLCVLCPNKVYLHTILRNPDYLSIEYLTEVINDAWKIGEVPDLWKLEHIVLIPKPGKPPNRDNLRPISLTSCVGKVAEHVVLKRLIRYLEDNGIYPHTIIGLRAELSTQNAMKLLKHQVIDRNSRDTRAILGLDLEKAFENVTHSFVLWSIAELGLEGRFCEYPKLLLTRRKPTLRARELVSEEIELGSRGTPQGSRFWRIEDINHTIYADEITIWCSGGSDGQIKRALQEVIDTDEDHLCPMGLRCCPSKSELLLYQPTRRGPKPKGWKPIAESEIKLFTGDGVAIPRVDSIRVHRMTIASNGPNAKTILKLATKTENTVRLVRVPSATSSTSCSGRSRSRPSVSRSEYAQSVYSSSEYSSDIAEAHERAQVARLSTSQTGRRILRELGHSPASVSEKMGQVPREIRELITVAPISMNVHPEYNRGRRRARAAAIIKQIHSEERSVSFVDTAAYRGSRAFSAIVVDSKQQITNCASVRTDDLAIAEQVAIALAILDGERDVIYTDSR
ncbi:uncharacterized protein LOC119385361 [Rhipicephalus sanguineus]|uniref:uncharacterized protein LOC119385361 n=1 Tax=Rhipicephalus sanguineus TaxID=34632 RepID=UPI00189353D1|nr:uncharacterized protein LOC119385361 [Rhipicephalus sanguineus]